MNLTYEQLAGAAGMIRRIGSGLVRFNAPGSWSHSAIHVPGVAFPCETAIDILRQAAGVSCCSKEFPHADTKDLQERTAHWCSSVQYNRASHSYMAQVEYAPVPSRWIEGVAYANLYDELEGG